MAAWSPARPNRKRMADVIMRVGTPALDNAHGENRPSAINSDTLPLDDDAGAIAHALWRLTFGEYRRASNAFLNVQTKSQVNAKEDDLSADFSKETAQIHTDYKEVAPIPEQKAMETFVRRFSSAFAKYPYIYSSGVMVTAEKSLQRFVSSEGGRVVTPDTVIRVVIQAETRAEDGMELMRVETMQADSMDKLSRRGRDRRQGGADGQGPEGPARSSGGRALRWPRAALRPRLGSVFPRSAGTPAGGPAAARRRRGPDLYQEAEPGRLAGVPLRGRRSDAAHAEWNTAGWLVPVRRRGRSGQPGSR